MKTIKGQGSQGFTQRGLRLGIICLLSISSFVLARQPAQMDESQARGAFLITRKTPAQPFPTPTPKKASLPKSARQPSDISKTNPAPKSGKTPPAGATNANASNPATNENGETSGASIGMGYTLYQRNSAGEAARVSPTRTFFTGDQVRFVIEPNIDGYLYIFVSTDGAAPVMLFPDPRLNEAANVVQAHVPYETPSRKSEIKWFTFDAATGVEHLYIVVSRAPLPNVPTGKELIAYCKSPGPSCAWKPAPQLFNSVLANANAPKSVSASKTVGQTQAQVETEAIARGLRLEAEAPEPTLVQMNVSASKEILVMKTELNHRSR